MVRPSDRPLTARSVIASTLLGVDPPRLPTLALVRSGELFGLTEGATRTALSRMAATGEIAPDGDHYRLDGHLLERFGRQQTARDEPTVNGWDGTWRILVVRPERRSARQRSDFRAAARTMKLGEVREGLWTRPANLEMDPTGASSIVEASGTWVHHARPDDVATFVAPFEVEAWAGEARRLIDEMGRWQDALDVGDTAALAPAFIVDATVIRHLTADPLLPGDLLPDDWPGAAFRRAFRAFDDGVTETWRRWYRAFDA